MHCPCLSIGTTTSKVLLTSHVRVTKVDIQKDYGWIQGYQEPKPIHPSSIIHLCSTGGTHGRGSQTSDIVGQVILHGKKKYWSVPKGHYHQGMKAGQNTLNLLVSRVLLRDLIAKKTYSKESFLASYITFMTTPDSHNDTYAEAFHRDFFTNYAAGVEPSKCAGKEDHNSASIGAFVSLPILILYHFYSGLNPSQIQDLCLQHIQLTHTSKSLNEHAHVYIQLFIDILSFPVHPIPHKDLIQLFAMAGQRIPENPMDIQGLLDKYGAKNIQTDAQVIGGLYSSACYISDSLPGLLFLGAKYADAGILPALLANANLGGDNCHRGAALGAILGAALGSRIDSQWIQSIGDYKGLSMEITAFQGLLEQTNV